MRWLIHSTCFLFQYKERIIEQMSTTKSYTSKGTTLILCHAQILSTKNSILNSRTKNLNSQENITNGSKPLLLLQETSSVIHKSKIGIKSRHGVCNYCFKYQNSYNNFDVKAYRLLRIKFNKTENNNNI